MKQTMMEFRLSKGWSRAHLANVLTKKLKRAETEKITESHVQSWENGGMPRADVGEAMRQISKGKVVYGPQS